MVENDEDRNENRKETHQRPVGSSLIFRLLAVEIILALKALTIQTSM
jgi:hypothetical protein